MTFIGPMVRIFLEVLLSLCLLNTNPAEPLPTLSALNLRTALANQSDWNSTLFIWTRLGAVLEVNII